MKLCSSYHQGIYTWTFENIMYTEFTKKKVFEQVPLAVACSACHRHGSQEVSYRSRRISISKCDLTWRTVMVELS